MTAQALHRIESEQSVLGALLLSPDAWDDVADVLTESDFFDAGHRLIFRRIGLMVAQQCGIDVVTVSEALEASGDSGRTGGLAYLAQLAGNTPSARNIRHYAAAVSDVRQLRDLMAASAEIAGIAQSLDGKPAEERIDEAQSLLMEIAERKATKSEPESIAATLGEVIEDIQMRYENDGKVTGLSTGFASLDRELNGLHPGDLVIVAGRPSMGKTAFALNMAENAALDGGVSLVYSLEMPRKLLAERCIASIGSISMTALRSGRMTDEDFARMSVAIGKLGNARLVIDDTPSLSVAQMLARARRCKRKNGALSMIVVDYIQLMRADGNNRNEEISAITRGLKLMARELGVPVVALSQLSRKVEERADKRPMMSDLRESGAIEQDADVILMCYRDEYYNPDTTYKGLAEILIRKQRMGACGDVPMVFQGEYSRFRDADPRAIADAHSAAAAARKPARSRRGMDE